MRSAKAQRSFYSKAVSTFNQVYMLCMTVAHACTTGTSAEKLILLDLHMAPMVPLPDEFGSVADLYEKFRQHLCSTKQLYDPARGLCLNAPKRVWAGPEADVKKLRQKKKLPCYVIKGGKDEFLQSWSRTEDDDNLSSASK